MYKSLAVAAVLFYFVMQGVNHAPEVSARYRAKEVPLERALITVAEVDPELVTDVVYTVIAHEMLEGQLMTILEMESKKREIIPIWVATKMVEVKRLKLGQKFLLYKGGKMYLLPEYAI